MQKIAKIEENIIFIFSNKSHCRKTIFYPGKIMKTVITSVNIKSTKLLPCLVHKTQSNDGKKSVLCKKKTFNCDEEDFEDCLT